MPRTVTIAPSQKRNGKISTSESFYLIQFAREIAGYCPHSSVVVRYGHEVMEELTVSHAQEDNVLLF
ncbi:protein of unknown function [Magnetospirillum gryphiswaldense MSR-1 v2]|uniref:Uncharacterized protein n=1 Tax=Magnetospirillum gryphiswaldense (strain DSM 6361 / JCM 21280 / NBRC 15271 / MSR-1) TaxID=431944 RepID=V6EZA1_MAGGM|nr:hypothetical protein [Magnetospirillum gryphiswaldense]CDK97356.1 protein of unknown function [Magnetospirillum gryphiswaldense MSR-1 v2]